MSRKKKNKPLPVEPEKVSPTNIYFEGLIRRAQQQLNELKHLRAVALYHNSTPSEKRKAVKRADDILKKKRGQQKRLDEETLQWLRKQYIEWRTFLRFIRKAYNGFRDQGISKQEALDKLAKEPRLDLFSERELNNIVKTNFRIRPYILELLSRASGFKKSTLSTKIRLNPPR